MAGVVLTIYAGGTNAVLVMLSNSSTKSRNLISSFIHLSYPIIFTHYSNLNTKHPSVYPSIHLPYPPTPPSPATHLPNPVIPVIIIPIAPSSIKKPHPTVPSIESPTVAKEVPATVTPEDTIIVDVEVVGVVVEETFG